MSLKRLIKDQKIQFHTHHRGGGQPDEWGKGVHIHKKMLGRLPRGKWELIFPLDDDTRAIWRGPGMTESDFDSIRREVRKALDSDKNLDDLKNEVARTVTRFTPKGDQLVENVLSNARSAARRIAGHFEIDPDIVEEVVRIAKDRILSFGTLHKWSDATAPYVVIAQEAGRITVSPSRRRRASDGTAFPRRCSWPAT